MEKPPNLCSTPSSPSREPTSGRASQLESRSRRRVSAGSSSHVSDTPPSPSHKPNDPTMISPSQAAAYFCQHDDLPQDLNWSKDQWQELIRCFDREPNRSPLLTVKKLIDSLIKHCPYLVKSYYDWEQSLSPKGVLELARFIKRHYFDGLEDVRIESIYQWKQPNYQAHGSGTGKAMILFDLDDDEVIHVSSCYVDYDAKIAFGFDSMNPGRKKQLFQALGPDFRYYFNNLESRGLSQAVLDMGPCLSRSTRWSRNLRQSSPLVSA